VQLAYCAFISYLWTTDARTDRAEFVAIVTRRLAHASMTSVDRPSSLVAAEAPIRVQHGEGPNRTFDEIPPLAKN